MEVVNPAELHDQDQPKIKQLKPARKQVKPGEIVKKETPQTGKEYNIWYNKWAGGDREDNYSNKEKAQTRCKIRKDSGFTAADANGTKYCCLFFARGMCPYGHECQFLHQLPPPTHVLPDTSKDCFARDKFSDYRDDMGGVGSFNRQNRTLYVGRIKETGPGHETEEIVTRHFKEWGDIERVKILQHRGVAFVTYHNELQAQFAKEAMTCQSLDNDEILNVRWATEDPNPVQKVAEKRRLEDEGKQAISSKLDPRMVDAMRSIRALEEGDDIRSLEPPSPKRQRVDETEAGQGESDSPLSNGPAPTGLLNADTLEGLKYFSELRKRHQTQKVNTSAPSAKPTGLASLGDYQSDEEDEE